MTSFLPKGATTFAKTARRAIQMIPGSPNDAVSGADFMNFDACSGSSITMQARKQ